MVSTSQLSARDKALLGSSFPERIEKYGVERSELKQRESTLRIVKRDDLLSGAFPSTWKLNAKGPSICTWCCDAVPHPGL